MSRLSDNDRIVCPASQSEDEQGYFKKHYASAEELKEGKVKSRGGRAQFFWEEFSK